MIATLITDEAADTELATIVEAAAARAASGSRSFQVFSRLIPLEASSS